MFSLKESLPNSPLSLYRSFTCVAFLLGSKAEEVKCREKIMFLGLPHPLGNGVVRVTAGKRDPSASVPCGLELGYVSGALCFGVSRIDWLIHPAFCGQPHGERASGSQRPPLKDIYRSSVRWGQIVQETLPRKAYV